MAGFSVEESATNAVRTAQGFVKDSVGEGTFGRVVNRVAERAAPALVQGAVNRVADAVGGFARLQDIEGAAGDVIAGLRKDVGGASAKTVAGKPTQVTSTAVGIASGKVGGGRARAIMAPDALAQWGGLSKHLLANLYPVDADGLALEGFKPVVGPITDGNVEASLNWQSPFENAGPESKAPTLMSMIQTGQLGVVANALQSVLPGGSEGVIGQGLESLKSGAKELEGRTGITKLNSRQVFSGMPPIKVSMTLHFRALSDARTEVVEPLMRLMEWALPQELAKDGLLTNIIQTVNSGGSLVKALFPSKAPQLIGLTYANERYAPMVIESVGRPLDVQRDSEGRPIYLSVQITLATLTALDKKDVVNIFTRA